jgi:SAM-dependent methyltransferase
VSERVSFDESYYDDNGQGADRPALAFYARLAHRYFAPGPILDFGCGPGFMLRRLARRNAADGLDVSAWARSAASKRVPNARLFEKLEELPSNHYAGIVTLHVLEHLDEPKLLETMAAFRRSLRPKGRLLCVMPDLAGAGRMIKGDAWFGYRDATHINLKSADQYRALMHAQGFQVIAAGTDGLWDFPYAQGVPKLLDVALHATGTVLQFVAGRLLLASGAGESCVIVAEAS